MTTTLTLRALGVLVSRGRHVSFRNLETGNVIDETQLPQLAQNYVTGYLRSATFQHFVSLFEAFVFDFLRAWLNEYPNSLSKKGLTLQSVLDASNKPDIIDSVVVKALNEISYQRVEGWFNYLNNVVNLNSPSEATIKQLAEIKASRDVLVHNNGFTNAVYVDKSGELARFTVGQRLELPEQYHRDSWQLMRQIIVGMSEEAIRKLSSSTSDAN